MVEDYQSGRLPQPDLTNLEAYMAVGLGIDHEQTDQLLERGYHDLYRAGLARRDRVRPLQPDARLWGRAPAVTVTNLKPRARRAKAS
jgi:hypothetical protein